MNQKTAIKYGLFVAALAVLAIAYSYFETQSKLSQGRANTDSIVQMFVDQDTDSIKKKIDDFVGEGSRAQDSDYSRAINSIDYVAGLVRDGKTLEYQNSDAKQTDDYLVFSAVYAIENTEGATNYLLVVMRKTNDSWILTNIQLRGDNPFSTS